MLRLSILEQCLVQHGSTVRDVLDDAVRLARLAEAHRYHRFWIAEHHGTEAFACGSPEILVAHIASQTARIRVGSGGVMLRHYSPYKVAESFNLLQALYPDRIDLGVGRAPGGDTLSAAALAYGSRVGMEFFPAKLADLQAFIRGELPCTEALACAKPRPIVARPPELWLLGSSPDGATLAAGLGVRFSFAHFFNPQAMAASCEVYRREFVASANEPHPRTSLAVFVLCSESRAHIERLQRCRDLWNVRARQGRATIAPSEDEAQAHRWTQAEQQQIRDSRAQQVVGKPAEVAEQLVKLAAAAGADELLVLCIAPRFEDRARCYELLAHEMLRSG